MAAAENPCTGMPLLHRNIVVSALGQPPDGNRLNVRGVAHSAVRIRCAGSAPMAINGEVAQESSRNQSEPGTPALATLAGTCRFPHAGRGSRRYVPRYAARGRNGKCPTMGIRNRRRRSLIPSTS